MLVEAPYATAFGHQWGRTPEEQATSRARLRARLAELLGDAGPPRARVILAGFSQGAGMAIDTAIEEPRVGAVASFSPCLSWLRGELPKKSDLRVLLAHGTSDATCPVEESRSLARVLEAAGKAAQYIEFDGGHTVPPQVVRALAAFATAPTTEVGTLLIPSCNGMRVLVDPLGARSDESEDALHARAWSDEGAACDGTFTKSLRAGKYALHVAKRAAEPSFPRTVFSTTIEIRAGETFELGWHPGYAFGGNSHCPFVGVLGADGRFQTPLVSVLVDRDGVARAGTSFVALHGVRIQSRALRVRLVELEPEVTHLRDIGAWIDGRRHAPRAALLPATTMKRGDFVEIAFDVAAADGTYDVKLEVSGYYDRLDP